jgi:GDP-L-fucose synthase
MHHCYAIILLIQFLSILAEQTMDQKCEVKSKPIILVTGGTGLVGMAIQSVVKNDDQGYEWIFLNSSTLNLNSEYQSTQAVFAQYRPKRVIHLAAKVK